MKRYFFITELYNGLLNDTSQEVKLNLITLRVDNVEQLTSDFDFDVTPAFAPFADFEFAEVQSTTDASGNTTIDSVDANGTLNSYNPLTELMGVTFPTISGVQRGEANSTISGNNFGIIGSVAPGIDRESTTNAFGNTQNGPFYMDIDFSKDFQMIFTVEKLVGGVSTGIQYHKYEHKAELCRFKYETYQVVNDEITGIKDHTEQAFLSPVLNTGHGEYSCLTVAPCKGTLTKKLATRIKPNVPVQVDDRGFGECCYENLALASTSSTDDRKNDFKSWMFKRDLPSDTYDLTLIKDGGGPGNEFVINNNTYGEYYDFGDFTDKPDLKGFKLEWRKVLIAHGEGNYYLKVEFTSIGQSYTHDSVSYQLKEFTAKLADDTFRLDTVMNSYLKWLDIDFRGLKWENSLRWEGFFGRRKETFESEELTYADDDKVQDITTELTNRYNLQVLLAPECITKELVEYHLFADEMFAFDYNGNNHSYNYNRLPVRLSEAEEPNQYDTTRLETKNYLFTDRFRNLRKSNC